MYVGKLSFKKALAISALWHFLLGVCFVIIINPAGFSTSKFSTVSFLGAILQEAQMQKNKPAATGVSRPYISQVDLDKLNKFLDRSNVKINMPGKMVSPKILKTPKESGYKVSFKEILADYKEEPQKVYSAPGMQRYKLSAVSIDGEIKGREIIYKPSSFADYTLEHPGEFFKDLPEELMLEIDFTVSQEGKIETANILKSTEIAEFDSRAKSYIKKWLFVPMPAAFKDKSQRGTITIRFSRLE